MQPENSKPQRKASLSRPPFNCACLMATLLWPTSNGRSSSRGQPFPSRARNLLRTIIPCLILHWWRAILRFLSAMLARYIFLILWNACFIDFFNLSDQITGIAEERAERANRTNSFRQGRSLWEEHRRDDGGDVVVVQCIPEDNLNRRNNTRVFPGQLFWFGVAAHIQDLRDITDDAANRRETLPIVFRDRASRWLITLIAMPGFWCCGWGALRRSHLLAPRT